MKNNNIGAWYPKKDGRDFILNYDPNKEVPEGYTCIEPLPGIKYQKFDDETQAWVPDPHAQAVGEANTERTQIIAEIALRDYRALKAFKLGEALDDIYPGESAWYKEQIARINKLDMLLDAGEG